MNQTELLHYLSQCLAEEHHRPPNHANHLATALATRLLATQGLDARLSQDDLIALEPMGPAIYRAQLRARANGRVLK